jgi:hypothetical protein
MKKPLDFLITFIIYHRAVVKQDDYMTHMLSYAMHNIQCRRCKIHRYESVAAHIEHLYS